MFTERSGLIPYIKRPGSNRHTIKDFSEKNRGNKDKHQHAILQSSIGQHAYPGSILQMCDDNLFHFAATMLRPLALILLFVVKR
jgi:hypothetical protein